MPVPHRNVMVGSVTPRKQGNAMTKVYRHFDQAGLDAEYNLRARFPKHPEHFAAWAADSAAARAKLACRLDLAYGPTALERLDFFPAAAADHARAPLLVFIHGGYWQFLDKSDHSFLARPFVEAGIAFAAVNYALAPTVRIDEIVRQVRASIAWLWREAPGLGVDSGRITVAGHSAGGHLAAMMMASDWTELGGLPADLVKGVIAVSGIYDLEPMRLCYHQPALRLDPAAVARLSPLRLKPLSGDRLVLAVGSKEPAEFHRQQAELAAAWRRVRIAVEEIPARNLDHFEIVPRFADPRHAIGRAALKLASSA